jgi:hypothetical protein
VILRSRQVRIIRARTTPPQDRGGPDARATTGGTTAAGISGNKLTSHGFGRSPTPRKTRSTNCCLTTHRMGCLTMPASPLRERLLDRHGVSHGRAPQAEPEAGPDDRWSASAGGAATSTTGSWQAQQAGSP